MIRSIFSDLPTFKPLSFRPNMNVLLADRSPDATERQTRNRAGKSSLIEIIHFLTGSDADPSSIFRQPALVNYEFGIDFDLAGSQTVVTRSGSRPSKLTVVGAETEHWPIEPTLDKRSGYDTISNADWRRVLGELMFGLSVLDDDRSDEKFGPTFRMLYSYFVRRQGAEAFSDPFRQSSMQRVWDQQVAISFLLGLDWTIPQQWQRVRQREREIEELRKAASHGTLGVVIGTVAELRTELAVLNERIRRLHADLDRFQVLPQYREYEREASTIARELGSLADENTIDLRLIDQLRTSLEQETVPERADIEQVYQDVGVTLPGAVTRRFEDVLTFHQSVIRNRQSYLGGGIAAAQQRIASRQMRMRQIADRQSTIMRLLQSHGALDQFTQLREELARLEAEAEAVRQRYSAAEKLEGTKAQLNLERNQLLLRLQQDHREQEETLRHAIVTFQEISAALYEDAGVLTISESSSGPKFDVRIHGARSKGITNMQIYCFDMMLIRLCTERGLGPGFLVHDSHLFDGVDERQIARAMEVGSLMSNEFHFQYIVTMNSDDVPSPETFGSEFSFEEHLLPVRLTDATEEGGLFGFRFS